MYLSKHSAALMSFLSYARSDWFNHVSFNSKPRPLSGRLTKGKNCNGAKQRRENITYRISSISHLKVVLIHTFTRRPHFLHFFDNFFTLSSVQGRVGMDEMRPSSGAAAHLGLASIFPPGLQAIYGECRRLYSDQANPLQVTAIVKYW